MFTRYFSSASAAVVVTSGLLLMMAGLIAQQHGPLLPVARHVFDPWIAVTPDEPEVRVREPAAEPPEIIDPPPPVIVEPGGTAIVVVGTDRGFKGPPRDFTDFSRSIPDGQLMAIVTVAPTYPAAALRQEREGYVIVQFSVTANGSVDTVQVSESTHPVFERAAIDAVRKFRFRPQIVDGTPVAVDGVQRRITFTLQD